MLVCLYVLKDVRQEVVAVDALGYVLLERCLCSVRRDADWRCLEEERKE